MQIEDKNDKKIDNRSGLGSDGYENGSKGGAAMSQPDGTTTLISRCSRNRTTMRTGKSSSATGDALCRLANKKVPSAFLARIDVEAIAATGLRRSLMKVATGGQSYCGREFTALLKGVIRKRKFTRNAATSAVMRNARQRKVLYDQATATSDPAFGLWQRASVKVEAMIAGLPDDKQSIVHSRWQLGMSNRQIAKAKGCSVRTVERVLENNG